MWLQSRVRHRVPETRDQRYERVKKEREARGKQVGRPCILFCVLLKMFAALLPILTCVPPNPPPPSLSSIQLIEEREKFFKPAENPDSTKDPFKTLFVGRLAFVTDEIKLKREFEEYALFPFLLSHAFVCVTPVSATARSRQLSWFTTNRFDFIAFSPYITRPLTSFLQGKPRGYAFIEFEEERSVKEAFDRADGRKIDGRRVLVDVERGRTVKGWKPRSAALCCAAFLFWLCLLSICFCFAGASAAARAAHALPKRRSPRKDRVAAAAAAGLAAAAAVFVARAFYYAHKNVRHAKHATLYFLILTLLL